MNKLALVLVAVIASVGAVAPPCKTVGWTEVEAKVIESYMAVLPPFQSLHSMTCATSTSGCPSPFCQSLTSTAEKIQELFGNIRTRAQLKTLTTESVQRDHAQLVALTAALSNGIQGDLKVMPSRVSAYGTNLFSTLSSTAAQLENLNSLLNSANCRLIDWGLVSRKFIEAIQSLNGPRTTGQKLICGAQIECGNSLCDKYNQAMDNLLQTVQEGLGRASAQTLTTREAELVFDHFAKVMNGLYEDVQEIKVMPSNVVTYTNTLFNTLERTARILDQIVAQFTGMIFA